MKEKSALLKKYQEEVLPKLQKELGIENVNAVPKITKIVINSGLGEAKTNSEIINEMVKEMGDIAGQKPVVTMTKKAISNFKIRENMPIGVKVTLRKNSMWEFLYKFINVVLPRVKDFRGINAKGFDGNGNYALGIPDHTVFPEIDTTKVIRSKPMQIIVNTTATNNEDAFKLLQMLGFPFKK